MAAGDRWYGGGMPASLVVCNVNLALSGLLSAMGYRHYPPPQPLLVGYDPYRDLPAGHLARLEENVVEMTLDAPAKPHAPGQPKYDTRLLVKVLLYGYATGTRSSRQLERLCTESLPYLYLTRGEAPSYGKIC